MDNEYLIVINAGSSSIKFAIFEFSASLKKSLHGVVENIKTKPMLKLLDSNNALIKETRFKESSDYKQFYELLFSSLQKTQFQIVAAGHRIVHGGSEFQRPMLITDEMINKLQQLIPFAPLHQPYNLQAINIVTELYPTLRQVACFDTAFHTTHPKVADQFGLPNQFYKEGIKRYGFHGLSYEFIMHQLESISAPKRHGRVIIAHLGNGASLCAVKNGLAIDSTMGFTALDGLLMGTRSGSLDPGVILYLLQSKNMSPEQIQDLLYKQSGLLGVSGLSSNMQELLKSHQKTAKEAVDLFVYRILREIGALASVLGGLDMLVFTGGIGEHAWQIREKICLMSEWLGIKIDLQLNQVDAQCISLKKSEVDVYIIPTNEEWIIAKHCYQIIKGLNHGQSFTSRKKGPYSRNSQ